MKKRKRITSTVLSEMESIKLDDLVNEAQVRQPTHNVTRGQVIRRLIKQAHRDWLEAHD